MRGKTCNQCQVQENMKGESCVGKYVTSAKLGKNLTTVTSVSVRIRHLIISVKCKLGNVKEI